MIHVKRVLIGFAVFLALMAGYAISAQIVDSDRSADEPLLMTIGEQVDALWIELQVKATKNCMSIASGVKPVDGRLGWEVYEEYFDDCHQVVESQYQRFYRPAMVQAVESAPLCDTQQYRIALDRDCLVALDWAIKTVNETLKEATR